MGGWAAGEGRPEAAMFNVECWILDDEWAEGSGGGQGAMFNVGFWILNYGFWMGEGEAAMFNV